ncbi:hypothetical protein [Terriglobus roseus]|uniref:HTH cro/C1-type domain-containing protein n=1 Tax=Terriglobus roseus TaxID=392734 RepID=A0A1H4NUB2_9BACT|nr:hypothetical protein [Terriglobus roseus]SEB98774.1 hypothetical protein SAMN05443244_2357 [Terriglobus roseus]
MDLQQDISPISTDFTALLPSKRTSRAVTSVILVGAMGATVLGVGNSITLATIGGVSDANIRVVAQDLSSEAESDVESALARMDLEEVRSAFQVSMTDLALLFGVSRTALYGWFQGKNTQRKHAERLRDLLNYAAEIRSKEIARLDLLMKVPLLGGSSFFDRLRQDENVPEALDALVHLSSDRMQSVRARAISTRRPTHEIEDVSTGFSELE